MVFLFLKDALVFLTNFCDPGDPSDPQNKPKNFEEELRHTLKERKRRGLTHGLSDTAEESDSDDSLDAGAAGDGKTRQLKV